MKNQLYYGDNLEVLQYYVKDESIDLIYLDPPFKSDTIYNMLFTEQNGTRAAAQIKAFDDTWHWDEAAAAAFQEVVEAGGKVSLALQSFRTFLGESDMLAYLSIMAPRLMELRRALKKTGSIYLHCDPTASHYLKMLMDAVFGVKNFQNEVIWHYGLGGSSPKRWARKHDTILFYSKESSWEFNPQMIPATSQRMLGQEKKMTDVWDIPTINNMAKERIGYPTQKPETLLERIIRASSNEGNIILDPFCGCGTTIAAAQKLNRRWIGIDITHLAINLIKKRLSDAHGEQIKDTYEVIGEPQSLQDAKVLAEEDPYQFQWWALSLIGARPNEDEKKKGADKGIDGKIFFHDEADGGPTKKVIISVKAGKTSASHVRDLRGVIERDKAQLGAILTMNAPTKPMKTEAASAGFYHSPLWDKDYPKLQILTIEQLLAGKGLAMPPVNTTFKRGK
jgi:site-specific DNA-methyltransferase (adenine-specific)